MAADAIAMAGRPRLATVPATAEVIDRFRAALAARDIVPPERIIADGSIHRCDAAGKNGKGDAAYLLHLDGIPAGDTPPSLGAAIRLDAWLRNEAQANGADRVPTKRIYQYGPNCVRDSRDLRAALAILAERGRARMEEDGRRRSVVINPVLLAGRE